ncbi:MAG: Uma2 family endonuclease [Cyanobacteria bacterium J06623_4]
MTALSSSPPTTRATFQNVKHWSVEEYHKLSEVGLLDPDERTELIAGQIILMAAQGTSHVIALQLLALQLDVFLRDKPYFVRTQHPIQLDDLSEPEPDLAIVDGNILTYADRHPNSQDVRLIVEIADTTLHKDCNIKDKAYAQAGISEYWVLDLPNRQLHIYQQPTPQGYSRRLILKEDQVASPSAFLELTVSIPTILPPSAS